MKKLPKLPNPASVLEAKYTAQQMRDYAAKAIAVEREACAKLVEESWMAFSRSSNARPALTPFPELDFAAKRIRARGTA